MALVHTLGDVRRFRRKEEVVAFVGLDPLEEKLGRDEADRFDQQARFAARKVPARAGSPGKSR
ncbi:MAG: transposase [Chloracidobacterium sp.]|nr:transposase [Chloracidobacterium sp.]